MEKDFLMRYQNAINTVKDQIAFWITFPWTAPNIPELTAAITKIRKKKRLA